MLGNSIYECYRHLRWDGNTHHTCSSSDSHSDWIQTPKYWQLEVLDLGWPSNPCQSFQKFCVENLIGQHSRLGCYAAEYPGRPNDQWALPSFEGGARKNKFGPDVSRSSLILSEHNKLLKHDVSWQHHSDSISLRGFCAYVASNYNKSSKSVYKSKFLF